MNTYSTRTTCRVCGSTYLVSLFTLGEQYVSDFVPKDKVHSGHKCPIDIELCKNCTLVQNKHTAPQDFLYTRHYWYRSGVTISMREALRDVVQSAIQYVGKLERDDVVLDIGSNDGTLLRNYYGMGVKTVGVEPAVNLADDGKQGVDILINDFWNADAYLKHVSGSKAKIITACGMFYDLEDPNQFIADIAKCLHPDGVFIAQLMCLKQTLDKGDVGNFAHEHLEFYSLQSLRILFAQHGMCITKIEENNVNGGSYRLFVHKSKEYITTTPEIEQWFYTERPLHLPDSYVGFRSELVSNKRNVVGFIRDKVAYGKRVWVYGASTKGNVILQYYGLDNFLIEGAADKSHEKHGLYTIGTGIPIHSEEYARSQMPDYFLVLPYAFIDEFVEREKDQEWRKRGGKFIVPLPEFRVI